MSRESGFRLERVEVFNWGTFDSHVWSLRPNGESALLTGDIGSGKSTLVDAITTLLVPPQRLAYNKAAGAEARERTLRSYVLGYYKSERGEAGLAARPVALRDASAYSVILARFFAQSLQQYVTLAQVFWIKEPEGQPPRFLVVADGSLSITDHFAGFGPNIADLRKRLRQLPGAEVFDTFPPYGAALRRRLGIDNEQALELFHQTVSMKSVGSLTEFVRQHMLPPLEMEDRIAALLAHFDDLNRAHEAVLKAKAQIGRLEPLVLECERLTTIMQDAASTRDARDGLRAWFAGIKGGLLEKRIEKLEAQIATALGEIASREERQRELVAQRDAVKLDIAANGGDRLERLRTEIARKGVERDERRARSDRYHALARAVDLPAASDVDSFVRNRRAIGDLREKADARLALVQNDRSEHDFSFRRLKEQHTEITAELLSLRSRRTNIPARSLELRAGLCQALGLPEEDLPFAGELVEVRSDERAWEGAAERVLHNFALSILVHDQHYSKVAAWVDSTNLGQRLVYYRVREGGRQERSETGPASIVRKLAVKPDSPLYAWLDAEIARRFDFACCDSLDQFRREKRAITRNGQVKGGDERHEKDDRHRIDDRLRYVLGWSNQAKISALEGRARGLEQEMQRIAGLISSLDAEKNDLADRIGRLSQLEIFETFREVDWRTIASEIGELEEEQQRIRRESDALRVLEERLHQIEPELKTVADDLKERGGDLGGKNSQHATALRQLDECRERTAVAPDERTKRGFACLDVMQNDVVGQRALTVESCDGREREFRDHLQAGIDAFDKQIARLREAIVKSMETYRQTYPVETQEVDASVEASGEYKAMLQKLRSDDLPRFEARFKELLNQNTIREIASFQSQLHRQRQNIRERVDIINRSLRSLDYNPGRYIVLEPDPAPDVEVRDFQQELRACTDGALTGSNDDTYSEAKFLQVKGIIERFRGREGMTEGDKRWTRKVTDVRSWFTFAASEKYRDDDKEHEHYADSGGKSGGQKEKLAYTVLAASIAYQFGLEADVPRPRSFRLVVIDEAFGRGSDESARYGLDLFQRLGLQLLIVTPLQKIHVIEPYVAAVGFVHNEDGRRSLVRNLTIEEYRAERDERAARIA